MTRDEALFRDMDAAMRAYEAGTIHFREYLNRLEDCVDNLSDAHHAWRETFRPIWGVMEDIYAYAHFKGQKTIPMDDMPDIEDAMRKLRAMVDEKLGETP